MCSFIIAFADKETYPPTVFRTFNWVAVSQRYGIEFGLNLLWLSVATLYKKSAIYFYCVPTLSKNHKDISMIHLFPRVVIPLENYLKMLQQRVQKCEYIYVMMEMQKSVSINLPFADSFWRIRV